MMDAKIRHADWREYRPPVWDPATERLIFTARSGDTTNPWSIAISPQTWEVSGPPRRLTTGAAFGEASVAADGRIVVSSKTMTTNVWRLPFNSARKAFEGSPERVTQDSADNAHPTISADGKTLVFVSTRTGNSDVWKRDLETGEEVQLTVNPAEEYRALLSPDGARVAFGRRDGSKVDLFVSPISGAGETLIVDDIGGLAGWSTDSKKVMYWWGQPIQFSMMSLTGGEPAVVVAHPEYNIHTARFSPDGRYISFKLVIGPGQESLFIAPVKDDAAMEQDTWIQVTEGSLDARSWWSPDGNTLYFLSWRDGFLCIWEQRLHASTKQPAGEARGIQHFHGARRIRQPGDFGYAFTNSELYFGLHEIAANIWMAVPQEPM